MTRTPSSTLSTHQELAGCLAGEASGCGWDSGKVGVYGLALWEVVADLIWLLDEGGQPVWANRRVREELGTDPSRWQEWLAAGLPVAGEAPVVTREWGGILCHWAPEDHSWVAAEGRPCGRAVVWRDVTIAWQREERLRATLREKQQLITLLTNEITAPVDSFVEREQGLRASLREKDRFIALLSRMIQHPVNTVEGSHQDLRRTLEEAQAAATVPRSFQLYPPSKYSLKREQMHAAVARLSQQADALDALQGFLDHVALYVRLENEVAPPGAEAVRPGEVVARVVQRLQRAGSPARLCLEWDADEAARLSWDEGLMGLAIRLVVENALRYSDPASAVTMALRREVAGWVLEVTDQGRGVPPGEFSRLGTPFFRASNAADVPGAGLSLALADRIVSLHGGKLGFAAPPTGGLQVGFLFPAAEAVDAVEGEAR